jgi:hypothetical protein
LIRYWTKKSNLKKNGCFKFYENFYFNQFFDRLLAFFFEWKKHDSKEQSASWVTCVRSSEGDSEAITELDEQQGTPTAWHCRCGDQQWRIPKAECPSTWLAPREVGHMILFYGSRPPTAEFLDSFYNAHFDPMSIYGIQS